MISRRLHRKTRLSVLMMTSAVMLLAANAANANSRPQEDEEVPAGLSPLFVPPQQTAELSKPLPTEDPELRGLLVARRDALRELVFLLDQANRLGRSGGFGFRGQEGFAEKVVPAYAALRETELELARTHKQRIAVFEATLNFSLQMERRAEAMMEMETLRREDYLAAKALRFKAEIELHKERKKE